MQKFVILSAAKNLLLFEFLLTEILLYRAGCQCSRANTVRPYGIAIRRLVCVKSNCVRGAEVVAPYGWVCCRWGVQNPTVFGRFVKRPYGISFYRWFFKIKLARVVEVTASPLPFCRFATFPLIGESSPTPTGLRFAVGVGEIRDFWKIPDKEKSRARAVGGRALLLVLFKIRLSPNFGFDSELSFITLFTQKCVDSVGRI